MPLHCSGVGKVLLSHSGTTFVDSVLRANLHRYTPKTKTDPALLRPELAACRRTGTAVVSEELTLGADSVSARIMNGQGDVLAALSVVLRTGSVSSQAVLPTLITSALAISRTFGWHPGVRPRVR